MRFGESLKNKDLPKKLNAQKPRKRKSISQQALIHAIRNGFQSSAAQRISYRRNDSALFHSNTQPSLYILNKGLDKSSREDTHANALDDSTRNTSLSSKYLNYKSRANFFRYTDNNISGLRVAPQDSALDLNKYASQES